MVNELRANEKSLWYLQCKREISLLAGFYQKLYLKMLMQNFFPISVQQFTQVNGRFYFILKI